MKKFSCAVIILVLCFSCILTAFAEGENIITIEYSSEQAPLKNATFHLYYIGEVTDSIILPQGNFADYPVSYDISTSEKMSTLAFTLSSYALYDNIPSNETIITDDDGKAYIESTVITSGAYLLIADKHLQDEYFYYCEPVIVILTNSQGCLIVPKYEKESTEDVLVSYKVLKAWMNDDEGFRPLEIEVVLLQDGEPYDTVVLTEENNWRYEWSDLPSHYHWTVVEKEVDDKYIVSLSKNVKTFLVSNDGGNAFENTTTSATSNPNEGLTNTTSESDNTTDKLTTSNQSITEEDEIPVTGMLSWPIPYLALIGVFLLIMGYAKIKKSEQKDEK